MKNIFFENLNHLITRDFWMVKIWPYFYKSIWVAILFYFQIFCPKNIYFEKFYMGIIFIYFVSFPFRTFKFKNDIKYIKYKFSHRFGKVCRGLNVYYSNIRIIIFFKVTTMSIWNIILKNLVCICKECKNYWKWAIWLCIYHVVRHSSPTTQKKKYLITHIGIQNLQTFQKQQTSTRHFVFLQDHQNT
jgi:hypothetical protein